MYLETIIHTIEDIRFSDSSKLADGVLFIERALIEPLIEKEIRLADIRLAKPGQSVRIAPVLDVVEPRAKDDPMRTAFPGFLNKDVSEAGVGRTHVLKGAAIVAVAKIAGIQEGLIDMQEQLQSFCPFARTLNLVLSFEPSEAMDPAATDKAIRKSILRVAEYLGRFAVDSASGNRESFEWPLPGKDLPKTALIYLTQSQGNLRRTYLYGKPMDESMPSVISPLEVMDGALVSGNFVMPSNKTCTYIHQNHPLIREMFKRHGKSLGFTGVILANEMNRLEDKESMVQDVLDLAAQMELSGAIINQEGGVNTLTDVMMLSRELERAGTKTVLLLNEFAGADGTTPSLAEIASEAEHIVSAGNNDYPLTLPEVEKFVGFEPFPGVEDIRGAITLPLTRIHSSTNQLGFNSLSCRTDGQPIAPKFPKPDRRLRVVHYLNQFFGQVGGEDKANTGLEVKAGAVGPGLALKAQLGDAAEIVATVICGDNTVAENLEEKSAAIAKLAEEYRADLLIAGPCFNAGRYGMACGAVCKAVYERLGIPTVTGIAPTNPGVEIYRSYTYMVPVGSSAAKMRQALQAMVDVAMTLAEGRQPEQGSYLPRGIRELTLMNENGAARAVEMLTAKLSDQPMETELPLPKFDRVDPAPPLLDLSEATIVLATEGGLTSKGNPDGIEMSMATKFGFYSLEGMERMDPDLFTVAHGGFDNRLAQEDPNRLLPLDVMREFEKERTIGKLADLFYATAGNATSVENATSFGKAIAEDIRKRYKEKVGVVFTST